MHVFRLDVDFFQMLLDLPVNPKEGYRKTQKPVQLFATKFMKEGKFVCDGGGMLNFVVGSYIFIPCRFDNMIWKREFNHNDKDNLIKDFVKVEEFKHYLSSLPELANTHKLMLYYISDILDVIKREQGDALKSEQLQQPVSSPTPYP